MKTNHRKIVKFAVLLATSIMIASASAQLVSQMFLGGLVDVSSRSLVWIYETTEETDNTLNITLAVEAGGSGYLNDTVFLKNKGLTLTSLNITVSKALNPTNFDLYIDIYQNVSGNWIIVDTLDGTQEGDSFIASDMLDANEYYILNFVFSATTGASDATFELRVDYN
jgi:hypothetical protein